MQHFILIILVILLGCNPAEEKSKVSVMEDSDYLFVGTYTREEGHVNGQGKGIHIFQWNPLDQSLKPHMIIEGPINPSYIVLHPKLPIVYTVNEVADNSNANVGKVAAYRYDLVQKTSEKISETSSMGDAPCHIALSNDARHLLVANYVGGSIASYAIDETGGISESKDNHVNVKTTPTTPRQESAHAHMIQNVRKSNKLLVADLGTDELLCFEIDNTGKLKKVKSVISESLAGPRHFEFHPVLDMIYVLNELNPSISVFPMGDGIPGNRIQYLKIPIRQSGDAVYSSAIKAHPSGNMVYAATRGLNGSKQNEILACMVLEDGQLHIIQSISTEGLVPRDFTISPDGKYLIVGNQDSHEIVVYEIDQNTFGLRLLRKDQKVPTPVCFKWLKYTA